MDNKKLSFGLATLMLSSWSCNKESVTFDFGNKEGSGSKIDGTSYCPQIEKLAQLVVPNIFGTEFVELPSVANYDLNANYPSSGTTFLKINQFDTSDINLINPNDRDHFIFVNNSQITNINLGTGNDILYLNRFSGGSINAPSGEKTILLGQTLFASDLNLGTSNVKFYFINTPKVFAEPVTLTKGRASLIFPQSINLDDLKFSDEGTYFAIKISPIQPNDVGDVAIFKVNKGNGFNDLTDVMSCNFIKRGTIKNRTTGVYNSPDRALLQKNSTYPSVVQNLHNNSRNVVINLQIEDILNATVPISYAHKKELYPHLDNASTFQLSDDFIPLFHPADELPLVDGDYIYSNNVGTFFIETDSRSALWTNNAYLQITRSPSGYKMSEGGVARGVPSSVVDSVIELNKGVMGYMDYWNDRPQIVLRRYGTFIKMRFSHSSGGPTQFKFILADNLKYSDLQFSEDSTNIYIKTTDSENNLITLLTIIKKVGVGAFGLAEIADPSRYVVRKTPIIIGPGIPIL